LLAAMAVASPSFAHAADAWVVNDVQLQSGPDQGYPVVADVYAGTDVSIQGCTPDWAWCDVMVDDDRGWIPGDDLEFPYQNDWVPVPSYAESLGIPIVSFSISNYWGTYYRHRPFYGERAYWYSRPYPNHWRRPIDVPPPHPIAGPPYHHRPIDVPPPRPIAGPPLHNRPIDVPPPHPIPNPPPRVVPLPHPIPNANQAHGNEEPRAASKEHDRDDGRGH